MHGSRRTSGRRALALALLLVFASTLLPGCALRRAARVHAHVERVDRLERQLDEVERRVEHLEWEAQHTRR